MVTVGLPPNLFRIEIVIGGAPFIRLADFLFGGLGRQVQLLGHLFDTVVQGRADEYVEAFRPVPQDIIGATPHEDATFFSGQPVDDLALNPEQFLVRQAAEGRTRQTAQPQQPAQRRVAPLVGLFETIPAQPAGLGGLAHQLLVIISQLQTVGEHTADLPAAAAQLTAYVDNDFGVFHTANLVFFD